MTIEGIGTTDAERLGSLRAELSDRVAGCVICDSTQLLFHTKTLRYEVCVPHDGNGFRWLFRKARISGFDRWANSTEEECFYGSFDGLRARVLRAVAHSKN